MYKETSGFTLVEMILVIALMSVLAGFAGTSYFGVRNRRVFEDSVDRIVADLRWTMARASSQEGGGQWGVRFTNPSGSSNDYYEIWTGTSYAGGTIVSRSQLDSSVSLSSPGSGSVKDIIFAKSTGLPSSSYTVGLQSTVGGYTATVDINTQGRIDYTIN